MSKYTVLAFLTVAIVYSLQAVEARRVGNGFCFERINSKTGECKKLLTLNKKRKVLKLDCCSAAGGAGWTAKNKLRASCEPCRIIETDQFSGDFSGSGDEWSSGSGWGSGSGSSGSGSGGWVVRPTLNDDEDFNGRRKRSSRKYKRD